MAATKQKPLSPALLIVDPFAREFADARAVLVERVTDLNAALAVIARRRMLGIQNAVAGTADARAKLIAAIIDNPGAFVKPKTHTLHGITVGFRKGVGGINWDDADQVVRLIKEHFPKQAGVLISTTERPVKDALEELSVADLKRIACTVEETGDVPVVRPAASNVDKLVKNLLKQYADAAEE